MAATVSGNYSNDIHLLESDEFEYKVEYKGRKYSHTKYNPEAIQIISGKKYRICSKYFWDSDIPVPYKLWHPLSKLESLDCPDSSGFIRLFSYIPIFSLLGGPGEIASAINVLKTRVFQNENHLFNNVTILQDDSKRIRLEETTLQPVSLSVFQRMAITAICVLNLVRGVIATCQLGFLFLPIDYFPRLFGAKQHRDWTVIN